MKVIFSEQEKQLDRQRDRFDAMVSEYLRSNRKTVEYLSETVGCSAASLWRYRKRTEQFQKAPLSVISGCMKMANASNETIRVILGLPTGKADA